MSRKGFTLIELTVVIAILGLLLGVAVTNFRAGQRQDAVRLSAQRLTDILRTAQAKALSGATINGQVAPSYGVQLIVDADPAGVIFADVAGVGHQAYKYDNSAPDERISPDPKLSDVVLKPDLGRFPIKISKLESAPGVPWSGGVVDIAFANPLGEVYFDGAQTATELIITLQDVNAIGGPTEKQVRVNRITGRIEADF